MRLMLTFMLFFGVGIVFSMPAFAGQGSTGDSKTMDLIQKMTIPSKKELPGDKLDRAGQTLEEKHRDFQVFAKALVADLNKRHKLSRSRMKITKQPDGTYRALFHQVDESSLSFNVRRSKSKTIPYVGVLSYQEHVLQAFGKSPDDCRNSQFSVVQVIPNRHIFSYKNGSWN